MVYLVFRSFGDPEIALQAVFSTRRKARRYIERQASRRNSEGQAMSLKTDFFIDRCPVDEDDQ